MNCKRVFLLTALLVICGTYTNEASAAPLPLKACKAITVSGSYILTKNITATGDCFVIQVDNVTIDFDGYTITGDGTGDGITDNQVSRQNITVRNGVITKFFDGIQLRFTSQGTVERMRVTRNNRVGIFVGEGSIAKDNVASGNGNTGITAFERSLVSGNVTNNNSTFGISVDCPTNIIGNTAAGNTAGDISAGASCTRYNNNPAP